MLYKIHSPFPHGRPPCLSKKPPRPLRRPPRPQTSAAVKPRSRRPGVALHKGESGPIFANAVRVAGMVARTLGPFCEVAVHDFSDMQHSLIHLEGSLTGRRVGAPSPAW